MTRHFLMALCLTSVSGIAAAQTVTGPGGTATSINVQTLPTGAVLNVTPAVTPDRRYVGMAINPQFSTLTGIDTFVLNNPVNPTAAGAGQPQAVALQRTPFRPAQVGRVVFVENDATLLTASVKAAQWKNTSFKDAVRNLANATHENLVLNSRGLEQTGINVDAKADYAFKSGTIRSALLAILQTATPDQDMVVDASDHVISILTQAQDDQTMIRKTYFLEDLLARLPQIIPGGTDLDEIGTAHKPHFEEPVSDAHDESKPDKASAAAPKPPLYSSSTNILAVITDTVRPEIWVNHGGRAEASLVGNRVFITAPAGVHALLDGPKVYNPDQVPLYLMYGNSR